MDAIKIYALLLIPATGFLFGKGLSSDSLFLFMLAQLAVVHGMLASKLTGAAGRLFWVLCLFNGLLTITEAGRHTDSLTIGIIIGLSVGAVLWLAAGTASYMMDIKGDLAPKPNTLYLVLKRPRDGWESLLSIGGFDCSSISYCYNGCWVRFRQDHGCMVRCNEKSRKGYIFIPTAFEAHSGQLESLIGVKWSLRTNCVTVWAKIWYYKPMKHRPWEVLPGQYALRLIRAIRHD